MQKFCSYSLLLVTALWITAWAGPAQAAPTITFPTDGSTLNATTFTIRVTNDGPIPADAQWVVFRSNNNWWPTVHRARPAQLSAGNYTQDLTPRSYVCRDTYAIRLMQGAATLAGPVHFVAGAGACGGNSDLFMNLENQLTDVASYTAVNQGGRDTCGAFAAMAALEAAYFKFKGVRVALSQHYFHHIIKSSWLTPTPFYQYENQSSYWGGNDTETALKFMMRYPVPLASAAPYLSQAQLTTILQTNGISALPWSSNPATSVATQRQIDTFEYAEANIPLNSRLGAVYGITDYGYEGGFNTGRVEELLRANTPVMVSSNLNWQGSATEPKTYNSSATRGGSHLMLIVGMDKTNSAAPYFLVKNSWGDGVIRVAYAVFQTAGSGIGWIKGVRETGWHTPSRWIGSWNMRHDNWNGRLIIRRNYETNLGGYTGYQRIGEYQSTHNGQSHCVWGGFTEGSTKLVYFIDFASTITVSNQWISSANPATWAMARTVCPSGERGQRFEVSMASDQLRNASGKTWWNNIEFPTSLWR